MTTTALSKEEKREAYIESVIDKIVFLANGWAKVPSSDGSHPYIVTVSDGKATDCGCEDCYRNGVGGPHPCKHREAVELRIARDNEAPKEPVIRHHLEEVNYTFYTVLDETSQEYHQIDMKNGRAMDCINHLGHKCEHRRVHPGVPCWHMEQATAAEQDHRANERVELMLQHSGLSVPEREQVREAIARELVKCNEAYREVMRQPIDELRDTREYWKAVQKRDKQAKQAYTKQFYLSNEVIKQMLQPQVVAA